MGYKTNDYNNEMMNISKMHGTQIDLIDFEEKRTNNGGQTCQGPFVKYVTYHRYDERSVYGVDTYSLTLYQEGNNTISIKAEDYRIAQGVVPEITLCIYPTKEDTKLIKLKVTPCSIDVQMNRKINGTILTRYVSYKDWNYHIGGQVIGNPAYGIKFCISEDELIGDQKTTKSISTDKIDKRMYLLYSKGGIPTTKCEIPLDQTNDVMTTLLSSDRCANIVRYAFDIMDDFFPGVIDYFNENNPFFRQATDRMFDQAKRTPSQFINESLEKLSSPNLNLPDEAGKQKEVTDTNQ